MGDWHELPATWLSGKRGRHRERLVARMGREETCIEIVLSKQKWNGWHEQFEISIRPTHFKDLARFMVEADPQEAIKAFGSAMQHFQIPKAPEQSNDKWEPSEQELTVSPLATQSSASPVA